MASKYINPLLLGGAAVAYGSASVWEVNQDDSEPNNWLVFASWLVLGLATANLAYTSYPGTCDDGDPPDTSSIVASVTWQLALVAAVILAVIGLLANFDTSMFMPDVFVDATRLMGGIIIAGGLTSIGYGAYRYVVR